MPSPGQIPLIARQGVLAVTAVGSKFQEDPGNTLLLIAQRLPEQLRHRLGELLFRQRLSRTLTAYGAVISGRKDELPELITADSPSFVRRSLGVAYAIDAALAGDPAAAARRDWSLGDLSAADRVPGRRGVRLRDEANFLIAESGLTLPDPGSGLATGDAGLTSTDSTQESDSESFSAGVSSLAAGNGLLIAGSAKDQAGEANPKLDALLVLTNSLSATNSGYSQRSHEIYSALKSRGLAVEAVTRPGYPVIIGKLVHSTEESVPSSVDGQALVYRRLIPWRLRTPLTPALQQHVELLSDLVVARRPAVLHTTTDYKNGVVVRAVAQAHGIPWVYEMRGELEKSWVARQPEDVREIASTSTRYRALRRIETQLAKDADAVIVLSEYQKQALIGRGVAEDKITVVPNGAQEAAEANPLTRAQARVQLDLGDGFIFGSISSVVDYEQHTLLVHALAELRSNKIPARLAIVGDGVSLAEVKHLASELGVAEYCIFPGKVDSATAQVWYRALDVFCVPRRRTAVTEIVTPMKSIPALRLGIPVLVSDLPALVEITPPKRRDSWVLPADDASAWASWLAEFQSQSLPVVPDEAARQFAGTRTWARAGELIAGVYGELAATRD